MLFSPSKFKKIATQFTVYQTTLYFFVTQGFFSHYILPVHLGSPPSSTLSPEYLGKPTGKQEREAFCFSAPRKCLLQQNCTHSYTQRKRLKGKILRPMEIAVRLCYIFSNTSRYNYLISRIMPYFFVLILIEGFSFSDNLITDGFLELFMYQTYSIAKSGSWIMLFFLNRVFSQLPCYLYIFQGKPETGALKVFQRRKYSLKYYQTSNLFCLPPKIVGYLFFLLGNG